MPGPNPLYVFSDLTFGTALVLNGLIRVLARQHEQVKWIVLTKYIHPIRQTIADVPNVQALAAWNDAEVLQRWIPQCPHNLCLGKFAKDFDGRESELYRVARVPYDARWTECRFPAKLLSGYREPKRPIALVYETTEFPVKGDFLPQDKEIFRVIHRTSALDWIPEMVSAQELHFIDSSFLTLAESLYATGALAGTNLIFHKYARPNRIDQERRAPWKVFE
jgi:hypothetical protein